MSIQAQQQLAIDLYQVRINFFSKSPYFESFSEYMNFISFEVPNKGLTEGLFLKKNRKLCKQLTVWC